jgi:hypothetical protein
MPGTITLTLLVLAQLSASTPSTDAAIATPRAGAEAAPPAETLKERLSDKASDEQRVDNCRVAADRRGATPRPDCTPVSSAERGAR